MAVVIEEFEYICEIFALYITAISSKVASTETYPFKDYIISKLKSSKVKPCCFYTSIISRTSNKAEVFQFFIFHQILQKFPHLLGDYFFVEHNFMFFMKLIPKWDTLTYCPVMALFDGSCP
jgi:hypothetical protein